MKKVLDFDWVYEKEELDKKSVIDKFVILSNRRDLRNAKVKKLLALLNRSQHFDTPLMVNFKDGKYRLLDGNHLIEAIKRFIKDNDEKRVVVGICKYKDLDAEQEREMFTKWNLGTKQNASDFIKTT